MKSFLVRQGQKVNLDQWDTDTSDKSAKFKETSGQKFTKLNEKLEKLQELLYAEHEHKVLIVLQAMDTAGKDGTIRRVFEHVNPQGVRVVNFKTPTQEELDHDFLWRIHKQTPRKGEIVIFNRSHYEDVLVVRVRKLLPEKIWSKRYEHINNFEKMLSNEGTLILKFYLHISREEQKKRLLKRLENPEKNWKFNPGDLEDRKLWGKYIEAYEDAISRTSAKWAPWHIIPANTKWYRDLVISSIIVEALEGLKMKYPKPDFNPADFKIE